MEAIALLLLYPVLVVWRGFVLSILWGWYAVPLGLPPIGLIEAIGVSLVVGFLVYQDQRGEEPTLWRTVGMAIITPGFALVVGAILHLFQ